MYLNNEKELQDLKLENNRLSSKIQGLMNENQELQIEIKDDASR